MAVLSLKDTERGQHLQLGSRKTKGTNKVVIIYTETVSEQELIQFTVGANALKNSIYPFYLHYWAVQFT